jgi:hypothetical protein
MFVNYGLLSQPFMRHGRELCYHSFGLDMVRIRIWRGKEGKMKEQVQRDMELHWCNGDR